MYGAIIGDIAGSTLEFRGKKLYDFQLLLMEVILQTTPL